MITFTIEAGQLGGALARAARAYPKIAIDAMLRAMLGLRKEFLADLAPRMPRMARGAGARLHWRVRAWRSGRGNVVGKFSPRGSVFARNLLLLERGGTIRPRSGGALAIPGPGAKTSTGKVKKAFRSPTRAKVEAWAVKPGPGRLYLFQRKRSGELGPLLFTLFKSVTIRPRLGLEAFWVRSSTRAAFLGRIRKNLVRDLGAAWGKR